MIKPLVTKEKGNKLQIFMTEPQIILWINQGIYALIPIEVVKNELLLRRDLSKLCGCSASCVFTWDQAIVIPPETGKMLAGE